VAIRGNRDEQRRAEQLSAAIDRLLTEVAEAPEVGATQLRPVPATARNATEPGLLDTVRQLARLPALLGPVSPALEQRVMHRVKAAGEPAGTPAGRRVSRLGWAVAGLAAALLLALLVTPLGGAAVASFRAVFDLGRTGVEITQAATPAVAAGAVGVRQQMTLEGIQALVAFEIPQPDYLPPGYGLREVNGYSYPDLPAWVPQPFFVELVYGDDGGGICNLRIYPIVLGSQASISGLNLEATSIEQVQDLVVDGQPGVLLHLGEGNWQELVWEHGALILSLSSDDLVEAELLHVAQSVGP
jgi:hypothetical protein